MSGVLERAKRAYLFFFTTFRGGTLRFQRRPVAEVLEAIRSVVLFTLPGKQTVNTQLNTKKARVDSKGSAWVVEERGVLTFSVSGTSNFREGTQR